MDHTTVKAEAGKGRSSSEVVPNGGIRDGSQETSKKKAIEVSDVGSKDTNWTEEEFALSIDYFAKECLLLSDGMLANDVPRTLVSDEDIESCFGPRLGQKGRNRPKINNCTGLPQAEVLHLFQVIYGHDKPVNGTLGTIFPRALYDERLLKKRINWAAYAHEKHKNQIRTCKGRGDSRPTGPPVVRPHRVYKPPTGLILEPADSDEQTSAADRKLNQQSTSEAHISPEPEEHFPAKNATNIEANTLMKSSPAVKVEKDALHFTSGSSCMPGFLDLKNDLAVRESRVEVLRADITRMIAAIEASRISLKSAEETISNAETRYREECDVRDKLEHNRAALVEKKQALEIRLDDGGFDEENPDDMKLLQKLELQEEELVLTYSTALTALEESNKRLKDLQTDLKLGRTSAGKMNAEITAAEVQILTSQSVLTRKESTVEAQKEELNVLQPFAESKIAALNPTFVPTATEVIKSIFRLSSCPVCSFGFHCMNFMPAPCGHAYHPACLVALVANDGLKCIQCQESFHPHWCESWGINTTEEYRQEWEHNTELQKQRDAFCECIKRLYIQTPHLLSERRKLEKEKRLCLDVKYTATRVERTWRVSDAATKVRDASPSSTIISSREEEKDSDLCLTEVNHVPLTRSKKGKRRAVEKADLSRKVRTRSYVTETEMSTGIGSPCPYKKVVLRPLGEIETPEAVKRTGALPSSKK
ncbi:hypothetical protein R1sor_005407 [Riccia sorocarpa]|uniref:RING-type domain-containing protein n=1 Tax=Riccia sorocarpa TaxID=122646 RepID=A0ABD3HLF8_9MARC